MYYLFLFLITFTRSLVNVFSLILLYRNGFFFSDILLFLLFVYLCGILVNYISIKYSFKFILILSSFLYGFCYIYFNYMNNSMFSLLFLALLYSFSYNSFHVVRHIIALSNYKIKKTRDIIFFMYLGNIISSIIGIILINKLSFFIVSIIVFFMSIISLFPIIKIKDNKVYKFNNYRYVKIDRNKYIFSVLEQFKVIFMELQPLFLFLYVSNSFYYVGIFSIITNIASLIIVYFIIYKIKLNNFKFYTLILGIILFIRIKLNNNIILFLIAFFEGIFIKIYDNVSLGNLYDVNTNYIREYLFKEELIFFVSKSIIVLLFFIFDIDFRIIMLICIIGIIISGFFIRDKV